MEREGTYILLILLARAHSPLHKPSIVAITSRYVPCVYDHSKVNGTSLTAPSLVPILLCRVCMPTFSICFPVPTWFPTVIKPMQSAR